MEDRAAVAAAAQAEAFKNDGNAKLKEEKYQEAVELYTRAIELDPDNAVFYSNRSAAYLAMGDAKSKALYDANKCVELRPEWWKGYSRKGAAEHALGRFDAARATYNKGLEKDPDNTALQTALEEAYEAAQRYSANLRKQHEERNRPKSEEPPKEDKSVDEDALLSEFMSEVEKLEEQENTIQKEEDVIAKVEKIDFGTGKEQVERLVQPHYKWINLNPFRVLMLEKDAGVEEIKQHYRKISTIVHPDKCQHPRAREAFEEVNKAYKTLQDEDRKRNCVRTIENAIKSADKERQTKLKKGLKDVGDEKEERDKAVMKAFAQIENRRLNLEKREAAQRKREAEQEEKQHKDMQDSLKKELKWAEGDRREKRVNNWREFQKDGSKKRKVEVKKTHGWKEERKEGPVEE